MIAVHFGAGNIGRGFIGCLLEKSGYEVIFLDVNDSLVDELNRQDSYQVIETGDGAETYTVRNFRAINSRDHKPEALAALAEAEIITASVGVSILKFLAPLIAEALAMRVSPTPVLVMACENSINATSMLRGEIESISPNVLTRAVFADTAVDRIVPIHKDSLTLDVVVESFSEWLIDSKPIGANLPNLEGASFVADLHPYIERKLFTVNTAHVALAYCGQAFGAKTILEASKIPEVFEILNGVLKETSSALISRHNFDADIHQKYVAKTLGRLLNPDLNDTVLRVGREPSRKLSRNDRLVAPAAILAEIGVEPKYLLTVIGAALKFKDDTDPKVAELRTKLETLPTDQFILEVMGIASEHPLAPALKKCVNDAK
jgi:mannitol-1-phosphate 5-dehydrogenase